MRLKFLLDTNICIYIAKNKPAEVLHKFESLRVGEVGMSVITSAELLYGVQKSQLKQRSISTLEKLTNLISPLPLPVTAAMHYAQICSKLEKQGTIIGNNDLWIAAHCLALDLTLVTNNTKEFSRIPNLQTENWCGTNC